MRHILAVLFIIMLLVVPWLMSHPKEASFVYSIIGKAEDQIASVILAHNPKTVIDIKSHYANSETRSSSNKSNQKVKILLVPGHEPNYGGAEYSSLKEREMVVELAQNLKYFLDKNNRYQVFITRDINSWSPIFSKYFEKNWKDIISWTNLHKDEINHLTRMGEYHPVVPEVFHNNAPTDVALRLYGISKWSNENDIDIIVHIHFNDNPGHSLNSPGKYSGFAIYVPQNQYFNSTTTMLLANSIFSRLQKYNPVSNYPGESGGIIQDQDLIAVGAYNSLDAASMLVEYGYIYEPQFKDSKVRQIAIKDLAFQTYLGLQDFFADYSPVKSSTSVDTLVMPYTWNNKITDNKNNAEDVFSLQTALVLDGVYPPSNRTLNDCPRSGIFGKCTKDAIESFQAKYGITGEKGIIGPKTLEILNGLYAVQAI